QPVSRSLYSLDNLLDHILDLFEEPPQESLETKRRLVRELLAAWPTLLVLDNMESVSDGRILAFLQELPPDTRAKVLLTSRQRTGGWELPITVRELGDREVREFIATKSRELDTDFPLDADVRQRVREASGGLPLAIQWMIGQYKKTK